MMIYTLYAYEMHYTMKFNTSYVREKLDELGKERDVFIYIVGKLC